MNRASMEPRSAERGNTPHTLPAPHRQSCFNGATLSRTWKQVGVVCAHDPNEASMEPRSAERGNVKREIENRYMRELLQWSHAQPNVETPPKRAPIRWRFRLQWSHAQPNVETDLRHTGATRIVSASMEPRSAERGNRTTR